MTEQPQRPAARMLPATAVAGALLGLADSLCVLASNPDPGNVSYRTGYALGPVLSGLAWAIPVGFVSGWLGRRRAGGRAAVAAVSVVCAVWAGAILADAWRRGDGTAAFGALTAAVALGAVALGRFALDLAAGYDRLPRLGRRIAVAGAVGLLAVAFGTVAPSGFAAFRGGTGPCPSGTVPTARPSILLISVDALRQDTAASMASYARLAAVGTEFRQHVTDAPWTLPSIASLLTGLPADEHGAGRSESSRSVLAKTPLAAGVGTIAGRLGAAGYRTHAIVTNPFLTSRYGIDRGFCTFTNVTMEGEAVRGLEETTLGRLARVLAARLLPSDRAAVVRRRAEEWLSTVDSRPFFLWLHFLDPHAPYGDRDGASTSLTLDLMAFEHAGGVEVPFRSTALLRAGEYRPGPEERRRIVELYGEDVRYVDGEISELLDFLVARGFAARTAIILTADHGEEFWDHGGVEHGRTLYEEILRVPLLVTRPGALQSASTPVAVSGLTSVIDLVPTILGLARISADGLPGQDLLAGAPSERTLALGRLLFGEEWIGVRTAHQKYMRSEHGEERLFDLASDPGERTNRASEMPEAVVGLRETLSGGSVDVTSRDVTP